jgi:ADP-ribose pyrophosphatase
MTERQTIFQGRLLDVGIETVRLPTGQQVTLEIIRHQGAAGVLPLHSDQTVTLVHQYRHAGGGMHYEIPAGLLDPGEEPLQSAARELAEEAQLKAAQYTHLATIHTTPGFCDERVHIFLATGLAEAFAQPDEDEVIDVVRMPLAQALQMVRDGRITDAKTMCALLMAQEHAPQTTGDTHPGRTSGQ